MTAAVAAALALVTAQLPNLDDPTALVFRLTVSPAPVPAPRLTYELLPRPRDRTPGNAAVDYLRAAVLLPKEPRREADEWKAREDMLDRWRKTPADKLPLADVKRELQPYTRAMAAADRAARAAHCDWQPPGPITIGSDQYTTDGVPLREVMSWLRFRFKVELAEGRTADAFRTLQTAFQMAKHVGEGPTLIQSLVGVAFAAVAADMAAEWAARPVGPNLYWALATLPDPLIDPRATAAGEAELMANTFPALPAFEKGPVSEAMARDLIAGMRKQLVEWADAAELFGVDKPPAWEKAVHEWAEGVAVVWLAVDARKWLKARGLAAKDVDAMPALQAVYLAGWLRYRDCYDDVAKCLLLPTRQAVAELPRAIDRVKTMQAKFHDDRTFRLLGFTVPGLEKVTLAHVRVRRQVAALQAVEAIRAHLATGKGLPKGWDEVTAVPVPDDPLTGRPFDYTLKGGVATIAAPPPTGNPPTRSNNFRYELTARPVK